MTRTTTLSLILWPALAAAAPAPITEVVVYSNRAQVTRSQAADCGKGEVAFDGLPSTLETRSLWASLAGGGGEVVGLTHRQEASGPRPEAKALQERIRKLDEQIVATRAAADAARATIAKLASFRSHAGQVWGLQAAARKPPVASWNAALDLLRQQSLAARIRQRQARTERRRLRRERQRLSTELGSIRQKRRRTTLTATVHLRCAGRRTVRLSYVVPNATWEMGYQVRSSPRGGKVTLVVQAAVHQGTGEDWKNVTLAVSTANLGRRNIPPKLRKLQVSTFEPAETRKVLTRRFERRRHLTTASLKDDRKPSAKQPPSGAATTARPGVPDEGIAFKLTAARRVTVPGDGRRTMVELERRTVRARYELETVPKLYPFVYNKVSLINPFPYTLLKGNVELHEGRTFVGRTTMKVRAPREPFSFSLGVENRLQVHRYVKKEKLEGKRAFGHEKKLRHRYVIQVGNWDKRWRKVRVLENVPVSQVREVEVTMSDDSTKPTKWNKTDGVLTWELKVGPRKKKKLTLDYTVHLPKSYEVRGYY